MEKPKANNPTTEEKFPTYKKEDFDELINYAKFKKHNYTRIKSSRSTDKITYNLSNIIITGTTQKYLEFDVTVKDNLGTKYLDQSAIRLEYDPSAFGNNIVANSNIIVTRGTLNSDTNCYASPIPSDANSNTILIPALEKVYSQCKAPILQTAQSIMHIKMKIQTCNIPNNIALVDTATFFGPSLIINYSAYANFPNDTFQTYYDLLDHNQIKSVPACKATLKEFWPKQLGGGVKDTLTIHGFQFGATRGNGNLYFKNANDGGSSEVFLDSLDYISWSDTLIKIFVPSFDSAVISGTAYTGLPAGTGFFRIVTNNGEIDTSHTELKIKFSVDNDDRKRAYIISPRKMFSKKITFHCSNAVANYQGGAIKTVVRKALADWTCLTGIDWELGSDTVYNDSMAKNDSLCVITFANLGGSTLARAIGWKSICPIAGNPAVYFEMDIEIDTNSLLHIDTSNAPIPAGYYDFYSIILHELGHSHNLKHVIATNNIMHYGIGPNVKKRDLEHDWSCDEGGNWVIDFSTDTVNNLINNCNIRNIKASTSRPCSHVSIKEISNNLNNIVLYPNPFTENLNISFNALRNGDIEISLFDITGKLILNKNYTISTGNNFININTGNLSGGIYVVNIQNSGVVQSFKLIKYGN